MRILSLCLAVLWIFIRLSTSCQHDRPVVPSVHSGSPVLDQREGSAPFAMHLHESVREFMRVLSLRGGGGQRKLQRERAARRKGKLDDTWRKLGILGEGEERGGRDRERKASRIERTIKPDESESEEGGERKSQAAWKQAVSALSTACELLRSALC
eukprot:1421367-Rhodomonas_salina.2